MPADIEYDNPHATQLLFRVPDGMGGTGLHILTLATQTIGYSTGMRAKSLVGMEVELRGTVMRVDKFTESQLAHFKAESAIKNLPATASDGRKPIRVQMV